MDKLNGINAVMRYLKMQNVTAWQVCSPNDERNKLYQTDPAKSIEENLAEFEEWCSLYPSRCLCLKSFDWAHVRKVLGAKSTADAEATDENEDENKRGKRKGVSSYPIFSIRFSTIETDEQTPAVGSLNTAVGVPSGYLSKSEVEAMFDAKEKEYEIKRLERENEELKKRVRDVESPINTMLAKVAPMAPDIISGIFRRKPVAVAGLDISEDKQNPFSIAPNVAPQQQAQQQEISADFGLSEQQTEMLMNSLLQWSEKDPEFYVLVGQIAKLAETQPQTYEQAKMMLKTFC